MRLPAAICALLLAVLLTAARADWATWSSSAPNPAGGWVWKTADGSQAFVTVEGAAEGAFKVTLSPRPPGGAASASGPGVPASGPGTPASGPGAPGPQVTAGAITLKGLPPLSFGLQPGMTRCAVPAAPGEAFFGLGEKFNAVNQRGRQVNMWVDDGYRSLGDKTYLPVPMVVSSGGWGLYLDSTFRSQFDLAGDGHTVVITHYAPQMTLYLWRADSARELLRQYCKITGLPEAPPEWAFGVWLSRSSYSTQKEVLEVARRWRALDLPLSLFNVEGWKGKTYHTFNETTFPDPRAMIQELHSYGWKVMLWNTHNIPPTDPDYQAGDSRGYFVKGADGKTFCLQDGYGAGGCLDVTNPDAVRWWNSLYDPLLDLGVDALFNDVTNYLDDDFGSQRFGRMHFMGGQTTEEMHNRYWLMFNQITYEYMKRKTGNDTVLRVAGGWAGQQKYSTGWAGDSLCRWEFLRRDITAVLSAGWSGLPYSGYDIPGYSDAGNPVTPELYIRWLEFGSLSPMMEFHSTARTEPWYYGDAAIKALRNYGWLRESLRPYLYSLALEAEAEGTPMARSLAWEYPADPGTAQIEDEFLLGPSILVAPIYTPGTQRRVYLPPGTWFDLADGSRFDGPGWTEAQAPLDQLPLYVRGGGILPGKMGPGLALGAPFHDEFTYSVEILPPFGPSAAGETSGPATQPGVTGLPGVAGPPATLVGSFTFRRTGARTDLHCSRQGHKVTFRRDGDPLPPGTVLRFEVGPPTDIRVDDTALKALTEAEIADGDKRGYAYRNTEQVCFVYPGREWKRVTLVEKQGQLQFERWASPARIAANAPRAHVEVSLPEADPAKTPTLGYEFLGAKGKVEGARVATGGRGAGSRWGFDIPLKLCAQPEDITWTVTAVAKTGTEAQSRPRTTTVEPPARLTAPETLRLADAGAFDLTLTGASDWPVQGQLKFTGPPGLELSPASVTYQLRAPGATRQVRVGYRCPPDLGLGEHEIRVENTVGGVDIGGATILGARPPAWQLLGPFPGGSMQDWVQAFRVAWPPETGPVDLAASVAAPGAKLKWQPYPADWVGDDGLISLDRVWGKLPFQSAYVYTTFTSPSARPVLLKVGSDDALMLWLNGQKVFDLPVGRVAARDQDTAPASLKAGPNTILAKVYNITDAWRFYCRITDPAGKPIGDLSP